MILRHPGSRMRSAHWMTEALKRGGVMRDTFPLKIVVRAYLGSFFVKHVG